MNNLTACPLDCYDACGILYTPQKLRAQKNGHTQGFLCPHLNHYESFERIAKPRYKGEEISLDEAMALLNDMIASSSKEKILLYKNSGNFGLMQGVSEHFFASYGATLTEGSLCDGAGEAGIIAGRGSNKNMPLEEIAKSEVVIVWGRNPHTSNSHLLPYLKGKEIIVIDPVRTKIADAADHYIQIAPRGDIFLALLLSRFLHIESGCDMEFLNEYATEFEDFYELTQSIRIKATLDAIDVTLGDIGKILGMVKGRRVAIVCGTGIQKYAHGSDVLRAIDGFAAMLGLFGKEGCGVSYLGDSKLGIESPFYTKARRVSKVNTDFSKFETVVVQGANPLSQMPDSRRVRASMQGVKNLVYFGLYENETSAMADLIIPAKSFLEKSDIRTSYSSSVMHVMKQQIELQIGISEYEFSARLCNNFNIDILPQEEYLEHFKSFGEKNGEGCLHVKSVESIPYREGFDSDDGEFLFLDEFDFSIEKDEKFHLITPKSVHSLNSQFRRERFVYLHPSMGYKEGEEIELYTNSGSVVLAVKHDNRLREDSVLIYSGTPGVNNLTTSKHSHEGKCAIYQENKVEIRK